MHRTVSQQLVDRAICDIGEVDLSLAVDDQIVDTGSRRQDSGECASVKIDPADDVAAGTWAVRQQELPGGVECQRKGQGDGIHHGLCGEILVEQVKAQHAVVVEIAGIGQAVGANV